MLKKYILTGLLLFVGLPQHVSSMNSDNNQVDLQDYSDDMNIVKLKQNQSEIITTLYNEVLAEPFVINSEYLAGLNSEKFLLCIQEIILNIKNPQECTVFAGYFSGTLLHEYIILRVLLKMNFPIKTIVIAEPFISSGFYEKNSRISAPLTQECEFDNIFVTFRNELLDQDIFVFTDHLNHQNVCRFHANFLADIVFMAQPSHGCVDQISDLYTGGSKIPKLNRLLFDVNTLDFIDIFRAPSSRDTKSTAQIVIYYDRADSPFFIMTLDEWESTAVASAKLQFCNDEAENDFFVWTENIINSLILICEKIAQSTDPIEQKDKSINYLKKHTLRLIDHLTEAVQNNQSEDNLSQEDFSSSVNTIREGIASIKLCMIPTQPSV